MPPFNPGPDAARYMYAANGVRVKRPFHLRWLLPKLLGGEVKAWWWAYGIGWLLLVACMFGWRLAAGDDWRVALAAAGLLAGLSGVLGPACSIPVQTDVPATGLMLVGLMAVELGHPVQVAAGVVVFGVAAACRETVPVWAALTAWSVWPLFALLVPVLSHRFNPPAERDPLGPGFDSIARHPVLSALAHHRGRWRDGWLMVAPWGVTLVALIGVDWRLLLLLFVAYGQLLIATDSVRLLHHAAGPAMAAAAANVIPAEWLVLAVVLHVVWFVEPERV